MTNAIVCKEFGPVEQLRWEEFATPDVNADEVRVQTRVASVGFMDNLMARGMYQVKPPLPYVPGACGAGVVLEVGESVTTVKPGDRVSFLNYSGAFSEEIVTKVDTLVKLPVEMNFEQGAAYRLTYNPAYFALVVRGNIKAGESLVVTGASGGVGTAAVQLGRRLGATVIAVVSTAQKAQLALDHGANDVVIFGEQPLRNAVNDLTHGIGADLILDVVGGDAFDELTHCVAPFGRILVMGFAGGRIATAPTNLILLKAFSVVGVHYGAWGIGKHQEEVQQLNRELLALNEVEPLKVDIGLRLPMNEGALALAKVVDRRTVGKIVLMANG